MGLCLVVDCIDNTSTKNRDPLLTFLVLVSSWDLLSSLLKPSELVLSELDRTYFSG